MSIIKVQPGETVLYKQKGFVITKIIDLQWVIGEEKNSGKIERIRISDILPYKSEENEVTKNDIPFEALKDNEIEKAQKRFSIIKPLLDDPGNGKLVTEISKQSGVSSATLYRWLEQYSKTGKTSALAPSGRADKGLGRINKEAEEVIKAAIEDTYLTRQKKTIQKTCIEVISKCKKAGIEPPHINTIRNRIAQLSDYAKAKGRLGKRVADLKFGPKTGNFPDIDNPLSVVQIDHTKLDIIIVDEIYRKPIGRPWITLAIDVYSRMVTGFYVSMDPPGTLGTGLCISNSILPKEDLLIKQDIKGEWPCWGVMQTIHLDNAREFRGESLLRSCNEYNIDITWRPVARPEWGGHIERLLGTFLKEIHQLPGTTFSNTKDRKGYDSEKKATFSLTELEKWLTTLIVEVYHNRVHTSLGISPLQKYNEGILGDGDNEGIGIPPRIHEPVRLKLDFLPTLERTIQDYGIIVDHIHYYHDVLRRWINATDPGSGKSKTKRKFIFKRDPRDISHVYFFDPEIKIYFPIPYRDLTRPSLSLWEYNEILNELNQNKNTEINEEAIFEGYEKLKLIEKNAVEKTLFTKRNNVKAFKREESRRIRTEKNDSTKEETIPVVPVKIVESENMQSFIPKSFDTLDF